MSRSIVFKGNQRNWIKMDNKISEELNLKIMKEIVLVSHMTARFPYPGLTGVNIHTFTLLRGVLRHHSLDQNHMGPRTSRALLPAKTPDTLTYSCRSLLRIHHRHFPFKGRPSQGTQSVPYQNCDQYNRFAVVTPIRKGFRYEVKISRITPPREFS